VTERGSVRWCGGVEGGGAEFAQDVEGAAGELACNRERGAGVAQAAGLQREVVGVVGTAGPTRR
jgi:hypothetical protein